MDDPEVRADVRQALQEVLYHEIPLSQAMGVEVVDYDGTALSLRAPLDKNINHKQTAFGGSLYSVAVLSGWGLLFMWLRERGLEGHIVIQQSQVNYLTPVEGTIVATALLREEQEWERFLKSYRRSGVGRIDLTAEIHYRGKLAVEFKGRYVIHR